MKKIDRRKAIKNIASGIGSTALMSTPLTGLANTTAKGKTIPAKIMAIKI